MVFVFQFVRLSLKILKKLKAQSYIYLFSIERYVTFQVLSILPSVHFQKGSGRGWVIHFDFT